MVSSSSLGDFETSLDELFSFLRLLTTFLESSFFLADLAFAFAFRLSALRCTFSLSRDLLYTLKERSENQKGSKQTEYVTITQVY